MFCEIFLISIFPPVVATAAVKPYCNDNAKRLSTIGIKSRGNCGKRQLFFRKQKLFFFFLIFAFSSPMMKAEEPAAEFFDRRGRRDR